MWKPALITTGQVYGACSVSRAYWGSLACGGVMRPCALTPIRASGVGRKGPHLFGVPGATTFLREGRGGWCPPRPCRLLCRGARDVFFLLCATCQPRHELSRKRHLCTMRCLLRSQRRLRRCACVSGICPSLSSSSGDSGGVSVRKYQSRLRPYRSFWRASCNIGPPSP
jgi:hypothetical protein